MTVCASLPNWQQDLSSAPIAKHYMGGIRKQENGDTMTTRNRFAALAFGLALAAIASPSLAQSNDNNGYPVSAARAKALRECSARQDALLEYLWGMQQDDVYRSCMAQDHQPE
ncbi:MAG: hypothetical protein QOF91_1630 [Alphaproteobacteria bacterium]|jgi:hypothetical protein|nr:hypothetical protein [Alphaproteobacteria bacterium]